MSFPILLQAGTAILAFVVACLCVFKWRAPRMMYFTFCALTNALLAIGYFFEVTAPSLDAAITACRICYVGSPFIGVCFYLFTRDYCDVPVKHTHTALLLAAYPAFLSLLVQTWPMQRLYYAELGFTTQGWLPHLLITPGPLYYTTFAYNILLGLLGSVTVLRYAGRRGAGRRGPVVLFGLAAGLPTLAVILSLLGIFPSGYDAVPTSLTLCVTVLYWYITRFRQREWLPLGREAAIQSIKDAFILVDQQGHYLDANTAAVELFPSLAQAVTGAPLAGIPGLPTGLVHSVDDDNEFTVRQGEDTLYLRASRSPLVVNKRPLGTAIMVYDDTENHHLMRRLQVMASHDALTGLFNRGTFFSFASRDFDLCQRKREAGSVLMLDIDYFKEVNDTHGHACGDKVLTAISKVLLDRLRHTDISGRYGGEELAVWLPGASCEGAAIIADVIRRAIEHTTFSSDAGRFFVTVSIGVAGIDYTRRQSFDSLVNEADMALYQAKAKGRNQVCIYRHLPPSSQPEDIDENQMRFV